jgi:hypothetical protein
MDGLDLTGTSLFTKKSMTFLETVPQSKKRARCPSSSGAADQRRGARPSSSSAPDQRCPGGKKKDEGMEEIGAPEERGRPPTTLTVAVVELACGRVGEPVP